MGAGGGRGGGVTPPLSRKRRKIIVGWVQYRPQVPFLGIVEVEVVGSGSTVVGAERN